MTVLRHPNNNGVTLSQWRKTAAGGETSLSGTDDFSAGLSYTVGAEQVFVNGVLIERGVDYTASTGTTVTGLTALVAGDIVTVSSPSSFQVANAIPKNTITAKGDLIVATGASTPANLAVGADGTTLVADSSTSTGLRYQGSMAGGKNAVINGGMDIWQRGTSLVLGSFSAYVNDRWMMNYSGKNTGLTTSRQATGDTTNLPFVQYCARVQRNSGETSTAFIQYYQSMETSQSIPYAGKTVTFSFYARAGANYSSASNALSYLLYGGTGTDQNVVSGYTGSTAIISQTATLTTTWQRFSFSAAVGSTITELAPFFQYTPSGTAGANDYFEITGVQLEVGAVATQFSRAGGTLQGELAACQRYLPVAGNTGNNSYSGYAWQTNGTIYQIPFSVTARTSPTGITVSGTNTAYALNTGTSVTPTFDSGGITSAQVLAAPTITAGQGSRLLVGGTILFTGCEL